MPNTNKIEVTTSGTFNLKEIFPSDLNVDFAGRGSYNNRLWTIECPADKMAVVIKDLGVRGIEWRPL